MKCFCVSMYMMSFYDLNWWGVERNDRPNSAAHAMFFRAFQLFVFLKSNESFIYSKRKWFKCQDTFLWNVRAVRSAVGLLTTRFDYCAEVLIFVHVYILRWCECVYYTLRCSEMVLTWCHLKVHVFLSNPHLMNPSLTFVSWYFLNGNIHPESALFEYAEEWKCHPDSIMFSWSVKFWVNCPFNVVMENKCLKCDSAKNYCSSKWTTLSLRY